MSEAKLNSNALFDLDSVAQDSPRLQQLKAHDIQTHHAPHCNEPWLAIPMKEAKRIAGDYLEGDEGSIASVTASAGALLDDAGLTFFGHSQREVEDAALAAVLGSNASVEAAPTKNDE